MVAEGYKDTEIGVIPIEWDVVKLGQILNVQTGKMNAQDQVENGEYPFFTRAINVQKIDSYAYDTEALFIAGEGNFAVKYYNGKFNLHQRTYMLTVIDNHNLKFIQNAIQPRLEKLVSTSVGSTVQSLRKPIIEDLKIPLPPLKEQEKIADILSTADAKIDAVALQIEKAHTLKKGLLQKLLSEGIGHSEFKDSELGKIPESWEVVELEKLLTFKNGVNASKEQYGKGYRFINVLDIINNLAIKHDDIIGLVDINEKEFELYEVKYGDILFQRSSETKEEVGQSNVYLDKEQSATFGGFVIKGSAKQEYNPVFMNYLFKIPAIRKQITSRSGGSTRYNIGQNSLNQVVVQFPPLKEQKQIAEILSTADEKLEVLRAKKEKYETLKNGLLQKLLSGEVRV